MADNNDKKSARDLLDKEDYEYEKEIYDKQKQQQAELEAKRAAATEERKRREKEAQKERERQLARERLELMKQKSGAAETEEQDEQTDDEQEQEADESSGEDGGNSKQPFKKRLENFVYLNKWWLVLGSIVLIVGVYLLWGELTRERPDLTIYMIADNGLSLKQTELEEFFEEYVDDIDGNGYVHVLVQIIPLDITSNSQTQMDNNSMFLSAIYSTENMLVITDSNTDDYYMEIMDSDLKSKFPDNKYIDERGFSLNMKLVADKLDFEDMPNDVHISIRQPVATVEDSLETAQENYEKNFKYLEKMVEDLTKKAEDSNDPGLTTQPKQKDKSSSEAEN